MLITVHQDGTAEIIDNGCGVTLNVAAIVVQGQPEEGAASGGSIFFGDVDDFTYADSVLSEPVRSRTTTEGVEFIFTGGMYSSSLAVELGVSSGGEVICTSAHNLQLDEGVTLGQGKS